MAGGGGETTSTVTQSNLPEYAQPYFESMMNRTQAESQRPYQAYPGQRLAGMSQDTAQGLDMSKQFAGSDTGMGSAANMTNAAFQQAQQAGNYNPNQVNNTYTGPVGGPYDPQNAQSQQLGFGQNGVNNVTSQDFNQGIMTQYASPYMNDVINQSKDAAVQNSREEQQYRDTNAVAAGAFGGSRAAVQNQMANNALQKNLTNIDVAGRQSAFENAQQQFERDRQSNMTAQQQNQNTGLAMGQSNQRAGLDALQLSQQDRQFGFTGNQDAYRQAAAMGMDAQKFNEQSRQFGADLGMRGGELMNQTAQTRVGVNQANDQMLLDRMRAQLAVGQTGEDYMQKQLDTGYNDFVNQRDSNRQNLQFLSSILRGVPIASNSDVQTTTPTNPLAGAMGAATGLNALYSLGKQG